MRKSVKLEPENKLQVYVKEAQSLNCLNAELQTGSNRFLCRAEVALVFILNHVNLCFHYT